MNVIDVFYVFMTRTKKRKIGKQNNLLELGRKTWTVEQLIKKVISHLKIVLKHSAGYDWKKHCLKRDLTINTNQYPTSNCLKLFVTKS